LRSCQSCLENEKRRVLLVHRQRENRGTAYLAASSASGLTLKSQRAPRSSGALCSITRPGRQLRYTLLNASARRPVDTAQTRQVGNSSRRTALAGKKGPREWSNPWALKGCNGHSLVSTRSHLWATSLPPMPLPLKSHMWCNAPDCCSRSGRGKAASAWKV
jgi:hypothetical protein